MKTIRQQIEEWKEYADSIYMDYDFVRVAPYDYNQLIMALDEASKVFQWFKEENDVKDWFERWGFNNSYE